jgi:hypothetical protein
MFPTSFWRRKSLPSRSYVCSLAYTHRIVDCRDLMKKRAWSSSNTGDVPVKETAKAELPAATARRSKRALSLDEMQRLFDETAERNEVRRRAIAECMNLFGYKGYLQACKESVERLAEKKR